MSVNSVTETQSNYGQYTGLGLGAVGAGVGIYKTHKFFAPVKEILSEMKDSYIPAIKEIESNNSLLKGLKNGINDIIRGFSDALGEDITSQQIKEMMPKPIQTLLEKIDSKKLGDEVSSILEKAQKSIRRKQGLLIAGSLALVPAGYGLGVVADKLINKSNNA